MEQDSLEQEEKDFCKGQGGKERKKAKKKMEA